MKESKFLERVRTAIVKFVVTIVLCLCTASFSAERTNIMITTNSENTLEYSHSTFNVSLATDSSLPYLHDYFCIGLTVFHNPFIRFDFFFVMLCNHILYFK